MKIIRGITILATFSFAFILSSYCGELKKKSDDKTKKADQSSTQKETKTKTLEAKDKEDTEEEKDTILDVFLDADVFITKKDKTYYHNEGCESLEGKGEKIKLSELKKKGKYKPCKKCEPPVYTE